MKIPEMARITQKNHIVFIVSVSAHCVIFCCSVATDLRILSFSPTDDLQDPVCYSTKSV